MSPRTTRLRRRAACAAVVAAVVVGVSGTAAGQGPGTPGASAPSPAPSAAAAPAPSASPSGSPGTVPGDAGSGPPDVLPSPGCGTSTVRAGVGEHQLTSGGVARTWIRHVPPAHDGATPVPLIIDHHGLGGAGGQPFLTEYGALADVEGFAVAFPDGLGAVPGWDIGTGSADVAFIDDLLDHIGATMCIDTNRVYASGYSLGGLMAGRVACDLRHRVAAVAMVGGVAAPGTCPAAPPTPVVAIHGTADGSIPYATAPPAVAAWAERNGCGATPVEELVGADEVGPVHRLRHPCPAGGEVALYRVEGGGHTWPGSTVARSLEHAIGHATFVIDASEVIWQSFRDHVVRDGIVAYTARYPDPSSPRLVGLARGLGAGDPAGVLAMGARGLRALAEAGRARPGPQPPNEGPVWVTVVYPEEEAAAIEAAASAWGADGHELHRAGGLVVAELVRAALRAAG